MEFSHHVSLGGATMKADEKKRKRNTSKTSSAESVSDSAALLELSRMLNSSQDLDFVLSNILLTALGKLLITKAVILLETSEREYSIRAAKGIVTSRMSERFVLSVNRRSFFFVDEPDSADDPDEAIFRNCCRDCGLVGLTPITVNERMVGIIGVGRKATSGSFESRDMLFLDSLAAVAGSAILNAMTIGDLQRTNRRLDAKIQEMNTLFEISREMNSSFDEGAILRVLGYSLMGQVRTMRYAVFTADGDTMRPVLVKLPGFAENKELQSALADIRDVTCFTDKREPYSRTEQWLASIGMKVLIPMRSGNAIRGLLCAGDKLGGGSYEASEIEYLTAMSNITISAVENTRLVREMVEKRELEREMSLARTIQKGLLPAVIPSPAGYDIAAINESSLQVGGDYYDVIQLSEHEFVLAIGDVSGKGAPASLLMANVQAALRTLTPMRLPIEDATQRLNSLVYRNTQADAFITFFWGQLDCSAHTFKYVNAGHNPPFLFRRNGEHEPMSTGGLILGVLDEPYPFDSAVIHMDPGDVIVAYTDGVNEALSVDMSEYGDERLEKLLRSLLGESCEEIIKRIRDDIREHTAGAKQSDDITMLALKRNVPNCPE